MIEYRHNVPLDPVDIARVFASSGIVRPVADLARIARMFEASNLVISAWSADTLVGICRALTDYSYCCYLSDLAVAEDFQKHGIGKRLIREVRDAIGEEVTLVLVSNPNAVSFYPKAGFSKVDTGYIIRRTR
jgi:ribosomal protein S18 acetylase RimI-like enzyme